MERPHFLQFFETKKKASHLVLFVCSAILSVAWVLIFNLAPEYAVGMALLVLLGICVFRTQWGIYAIALTAFFHGWEIDFSQYQWARSIPYLSSINAPLADFVALFFFVAICIALIYGVVPLHKLFLQRIFPMGYWYVGFLIVAFVSSWYAYEHNIGESLRYFFRPFVFVYCMYAVLPLLLMQQRKAVDQVTTMLAWVAGAIALFGVFGFWYSMSGAGWPRVQPFGVFGIAPLGYNHNMIAEVLVALIPFVFLQAYRAKDLFRAQWFGGLGICVTLVCFLTLSRAAWVVLSIDVILLVVLCKKQVGTFFRSHLQLALPLLILLGSGLALYMAVFLGSSVVESSNSARLVSVDIAKFYVLQSPGIGQGPGMFIPVFRNTAMYVGDFGEPPDAHGMLLKVAVETGILGLCFFVFFLYTVVSRVFKRFLDTKDVRLLAVGVSSLSAILFQLFNTSYFNAHMWFPIGLALATYQLSRYGDGYVG